MGSNGGTGRPMFFLCAQARREREITKRQAHVVSVTGRMRKARVRPGGRQQAARVDIYAREYVCSCGHVGWSRHTDLRNRIAT